MVSVVIGAGLLMAQLICICFLFCALLAPGYHREKLTLPGGNAIGFSLSLFSVECTGDCQAFLSGAPFVKFSSTSRYVKICTDLAQALNGKSIAEVTNFLCGVQITFFGFAETGCSAFQSIYTASTALVYLLQIAIFCSVLALFLIILFFLSHPTLLMRKGIFGMQISACLFVFSGALLYTLIGSSLRPHLFIGSLVHVTSTLHDTFWSFGAGNLVLMTAVLWCWTMPLWSFWAIKPKHCSDYVSLGADLEEETTQLIQERQRNIFGTHTATFPNNISYQKVSPRPEFRAAAPLHDSSGPLFTYGWLSKPAPMH